MAKTEASVEELVDMIERSELHLNTLINDNEGHHETASVHQPDAAARRERR